LNCTECIVFSINALHCIFACHACIALYCNVYIILYYIPYGNYFIYTCVLYCALCIVLHVFYFIVFYCSCIVLYCSSMEPPCNLLNCIAFEYVLYYIVLYFIVVVLCCTVAVWKHLVIYWIALNLNTYCIISYCILLCWIGFA